MIKFSIAPPTGRGCYLLLMVSPQLDLNNTHTHQSLSFCLSFPLCFYFSLTLPSIFYLFLFYFLSFSLFITLFLSLSHPVFFLPSTNPYLLSIYFPTLYIFLFLSFCSILLPLLQDWLGGQCPPSPFHPSIPSLPPELSGLWKCFVGTGKPALSQEKAHL